MEVSRTALALIMEKLSAMESTPFGSFPSQLTPLVPQELANQMPELLVIRKKLHTLAMRTYSAENAVLGLRDVPATGPGTITTNPYTLEDHIFELKSDVKHILGIQSNIPPANSQHHPSPPADITSKLEEIMNAVVDQSADVCSSTGQICKALDQLKSMQSDIKEVLTEVRNFYGGLEAPTTNRPSTNGMPHPLYLSTPERELEALKHVISATTSSLLDLSQGQTPNTPTLNPDDPLEAISLKSALIAALNKVASVTQQKTARIDEAKPGQEGPDALRTKKMKGLLIQVAKVNETLNLLRTGVIPPPCDLITTNDPIMARLTDHVNGLITKVTFLSENATKTAAVIFADAGNILPKIKSHGIWLYIQTIFAGMLEFHKTGPRAMGKYLEELIAGNFEAIDSHAPDTVKALQEVLKAYRDDHMRFAGEVATGNLSSSMAMDISGHGAWKDMRQATVATHRMIAQDLTILSNILASACNGVFQKLNIRPLETETPGVMYELIEWVHRLLNIIGSHHVDIVTLAKNVVTGKPNIPLLPTGPHRGTWGSSRKSLNEVLVCLGRARIQ